FWIILLLVWGKLEHGMIPAVAGFGGALPRLTIPPAIASLLHSTPFSISNPNLRRRSLLRIEIHQHTIGQISAAASTWRSRGRKRLFGRPDMQRPPRLGEPQRSFGLFLSRAPQWASACSLHAAGNENRF